MSNTASLIDIPSKDLDNWFDQRFAEKMAEREAAHIPSMTIIATKGTLDMAYPPLYTRLQLLAALGWDVSIFFYLLWTEPVEADPGS